MKKIKIGCGLISIGRKWASHKFPLNDKKSSLFLKNAFNLGITLFDTAPSYGDSEKKLGKFVSTLSIEDRKKIKVATKFGEHWDNLKNEAYVDHSYNACKESIDNSIKLLKKIDILQLHKTTLETLNSKDFFKTITYAQKKEIKEFGVSIKDFESAKKACSLTFIKWIQLPYNLQWRDQEKTIDYLINKNKKIIINRPFNSGKIFEKNNKPKEALDFIFKKQFQGYILTGTRNIKHLEQNIRLFNNFQ